MSWGRALGPFRGFSTGQLNCCLPRMEEKREETLIYQNIDLFATTVSDLVGTNLPKMHIDTENAKPIRTLNYRQTPAAQKQMQRQVKSVFDAGIIDESYSPWNSPTLLIRTRKYVLSNLETLQCNFFIFDHVT